MPVRTLGRIMKFAIILAVIALLGLTGYAALFDLPPPEREQVISVPLPTN